jgi:hypothetical protein
MSDRKEIADVRRQQKSKFTKDKGYTAKQIHTLEGLD